MAYGVVHFFPNGTKEQYESTLSAVHPDRTSLPQGQIHHAAGPTEGGFVVFVLHDSKASWERFRDGTLMPRLAKGVQGGFTTPPQERVFEVHNLLP